MHVRVGCKRTALGSLLCTLTMEPFFASSRNTSPRRVWEGTVIEEVEKSKMSCIGDYMEMGLLTDWDITKFQYLVEIRTSFLLNSFRKKDLFRKFLSELKKIMTMSAIFYVAFAFFYYYNGGFALSSWPFCLFQ